MTTCQRMQIKTTYMLCCHICDHVFLVRYVKVTESPSIGLELFIAVLHMVFDLTDALLLFGWLFQQVEMQKGH